MELSPSQNQRAENFSLFLNNIIPQFDGPMWLIKILSGLLPDYCLFERSIFFKGILILYIPKLCQLNPFFKGIVKYRLSTYYEIS